MAKAILYLHWKTIQFGMVPFVIAAFGLPLMLVQNAARPEGLTDGYYTSYLLDSMAPSLVFFPLLAAVTGVTLALSTWSWDHQGKHVYALSLPIARWRYATLKFGAGALLALLPTAALLVGAVAATASVDLPPLLHAYPLAITVRFFFSTLLVYAVVFAFAAGSIRTTVILLTVWISALLGGNLLVEIASLLVNRPELQTFNLNDWLFEMMVRWPGPGHILTGNWSLIDV